MATAWKGHCVKGSDTAPVLPFCPCAAGPSERPLCGLQCEILFIPTLNALL